MELMSSLLFFTLCTLVPQALGIHMGNMKVFHNHTQFKDKHYKQKQISVNMRTPSFTVQSPNKSESQQELHCRECRGCMENAVKHHLSHHKYIVDRNLSDEDPHHKVLSNDINFNYADRSKRSAAQIEMKTKLTKDKDKKNGKQRFFAVTKYLQDGEVLALKIKEYTEQLNQANNSVLQKDTSTCQIYQVKKTLSCKSFEGTILLQAVDRKKNSTRRKKHVLKKITSALVEGVEERKPNRTFIALPTEKKLEKQTHYNKPSVGKVVPPI